ncbi:MAG: hypothetical protein ACRCUS_02435, partial [Anaerovoracaceae bacterium]
DLVTGTEKPRVFLDYGTLVTVPTGLFELAEAGLEILEKTEWNSALGEILICRVRDSGYVQVAGPVTNTGQKSVVARMMELGAELVLIDGAIDRKSVAAPDTSEAVILSTGAVLSRSLKSVVEETAHTVRLYSLPVHNKTELESSEREIIKIEGAFTKNTVAHYDSEKLSKTLFVLKDPTKIFIESMEWRRLLKRGMIVEVEENIEIAAITVNPTAPAGYHFASQELIAAMKKEIPEIPIIDVRIT